MAKITFHPQLSDREANRVSGQRWRSDDGREFTGPEMAKRAWQRGWISYADELLRIPVGGWLKTGVSAYERLA